MMQQFGERENSGPYVQLYSGGDGLLDMRTLQMPMSENDFIINGRNHWKIFSWKR